MLMLMLTRGLMRMPGLRLILRLTSSSRLLVLARSGHDRPSELPPARPDDPDHHVDEAVYAKDEELGRQQQAGDKRHDEHGRRPRRPRGGEEEAHERERGDEHADRG